MNAKRSSAWVLNSVLASSSLVIAANGVVAERLRHLIVDQDYASSNLVDPADVECWRGRADRGASLLKRFTRVQILPPALALEALMAKHRFLKPGRRVRVPTGAPVV
jgi:hypothetical protein